MQNLLICLVALVPAIISTRQVNINIHGHHGHRYHGHRPYPYGIVHAEPVEYAVPMPLTYYQPVVLEEPVAIPVVSPPLAVLNTVQVLTEPGMIMSPDYPAVAQNLNAGWTYKLVSRSGAYIKLKFEEIRLQNNVGQIVVYECWNDAPHARVISYNNYNEGTEYLVRGTAALIKIENAISGTYRIRWWTHTCENGWRDYDGACYQYDYAKRSYYEAESRCNNAAMKGHVASILSYGEQMFLNQLTPPGVYYMGLVKRGSQWVWNDGSPMGYTNWAPREPDGIGYDMKKAPCTQGNFGGPGLWDDINCDQRLPSVCKHKRKTCPGLQY